MEQLINYSEFNTLTACERKFVYAYVLNVPEEGPRRGLHLGTLCHLWHGRWLLGKGATLPEVWTDDINTGGKPGEQRTLHLEDFEPELVERARWLAERFERVYGLEPPSSWHVISAEEWLTRPFGWGTLVGRTDGFVEIDGRLWLIEVKSYGSKPGPLAFAQVSPQLGCYSLLAEAKFGERPFGVLYQGMHTYRWKRKEMTLAEIEAKIVAATPEVASNYSRKDLRSAAKAIQPSMLQPERAPEESFQQLEVELGDDHLRTAQMYLRSAVDRRETVIRRTEAEGISAAALPSIGTQCGYCSFKPQCWNDLGGVEEFEIEVEDDDYEPV